MAPNPNETKGLGSEYHGPAEIISVDEHDATLRFVSNGIVRVRNVSHLRHYFLRHGEEERVRTDLATGPKRVRSRYDQADREANDQIDGAHQAGGVSQATPSAGRTNEKAGSQVAKKRVTFADGTKPN